MPSCFSKDFPSKNKLGPAVSWDESQIRPLAPCQCSFSTIVIPWGTGMIGFHGRSLHWALSLCNWQLLSPFSLRAPLGAGWHSFHFTEEKTRSYLDCFVLLGSNAGVWSQPRNLLIPESVLLTIALHTVLASVWGPVRSRWPEFSE